MYLLYAACYCQGEFSEGLMHGNGKYTWADGVIYEVSLTNYVMPLEILSVSLHGCEFVIISVRS